MEVTMGWLTPEISPSVSTMRPHCRDARGYLRRKPSHGHLHARAQRLALYRRHPQQSHRAISHTRCRSGMDGPALLLGSAGMIFASLFDVFRGKAVTIP